VHGYINCNAYNYLSVYQLVKLYYLVITISTTRMKNTNQFLTYLDFHRRILITESHIRLPTVKFVFYHTHIIILNIIYWYKGYVIVTTTLCAKQSGYRELFVAGNLLISRQSANGRTLTILFYNRSYVLYEFMIDNNYSRVLTSSD